MVVPSTTEAASQEPVSGIQAIGINGSILATQIVNFAILFALLRWLLYRPILAMLEKRRKAIEEGVALAERSKREADEADTKRRAALSETQKEMRTILESARERARVLVETAQQQAQTEAAALVAQSQEQIEREKEQVAMTLENELGDLVIRATEKILGERDIQLNPKEIAAALAVAKADQ